VHSVLTVFRYFRFPDQQYVDERDSLVSKSNSVFDFGVRAGVEAVKNFTFSGEFIYRTYINNKALNDAEKNSKTARFKFTANFEYEFLKNKFLTFTVGRDFDSPVKTGGNVILALQAALGFGSTRTVK
jgi:hypothetical protein